MGTLYLILVIVIVLCFIATFFVIEEKMKWILRGIIILCALIAVIYEAIANYF